MAFCSHFALLWIVTPCAAVMDTDGRKVQFCSLIFHQEVIRECAQIELLSGLVSLSSLLKPILSRSREPDGKTPTVFCQSCVWPSFFSCEIQLYSMKKPHKLIVLRSLTWVAFILVHSAFLHGVNRVILRTHQRLRTLWDLYHVEFTQHEQLGLKENFHYSSAVYNLRHLSKKQWYHPEGIVCTCFKVGL